MLSFHITVGGEPYCNVVDYSRLPHKVRMENPPVCGHSSLEDAAADALVIQSVHPGERVLIVAGSCPETLGWDDDGFNYPE